MSLDQTLLHVEESLSLITIVAAALAVKLVLESALYLLPLELLLGLD